MNLKEIYCFKVFIQRKKFAQYDYSNQGVLMYLKIIYFRTINPSENFRQFPYAFNLRFDPNCSMWMRMSEAYC